MRVTISVYIHTLDEIDRKLSHSTNLIWLKEFFITIAKSEEGNWMTAFLLIFNASFFNRRPFNNYRIGKPIGMKFGLEFRMLCLNETLLRHGAKFFVLYI